MTKKELDKIVKVLSEMVDPEPKTENQHTMLLRKFREQDKKRLEEIAKNPLSVGGREISVGDVRQDMYNVPHGDGKIWIVIWIRRYAAFGILYEPYDNHPSLPGEWQAKIEQSVHLGNIFDEGWDGVIR